MFSVRALGTGYVPTGCTDRELLIPIGLTPFFAWGHVILSGLDAHLKHEGQGTAKTKSVLLDQPLKTRFFSPFWAPVLEVGRCVGIRMPS